MSLPRHLHLVLSTPTRVVVDEPRVTALRAEDETGSFGIRPGHADFVTALVPTVLRWRTDHGAAHGVDKESDREVGHGGERYATVGPGVLMVRGGREVLIACREAVPGTSLETLEAEVARHRAELLEARRRATVEETRLETRAIRQIIRLLHPTNQPRGAERLAALAREQRR